VTYSFPQLVLKSKGSICCIIFSTWGVLMLALMGGLLLMDYPGVDGVVPAICYGVDGPRTQQACHDSHVQAAISSFIAAGVYFAFIVLSVIRIVQLKLQGRKQAQGMDTYAGEVPAAKYN
jgi:hypothetical protein